MYGRSATTVFPHDIQIPNNHRKSRRSLYALKLLERVLEGLFCSKETSILIMEICYMKLHCPEHLQVSHRNIQTQCYFGVYICGHCYWFMLYLVALEFQRQLYTEEKLKEKSYAKGVEKYFVQLVT
nr:unnamed protein product [Callosobruchus chinensis]